MKHSRVWATVIRLTGLAVKTGRLAQANGVPSTWRRIVRYARRRGIVGLVHQANEEQAFQQWLQVHLPGTRALDDLRTRSSGLQIEFSVLMPVYNTDPRWLKCAISSVTEQIYPHWQLCIADDGSDSPDTRAVLDALSNPRIRVTRLEKHSGISAATNAALALAECEFVAFLDHDDELPAHALASLALAIDVHPDVDLAYTDECALEGSDHKTEPFFKPEFSPDLLLSMNYIGHLVAVRRELVREVGTLRSEYDGSQDYDLLLRLVERAHQIVHVPDILYYWRRTPGSTSDSPEAKPYASEAAIRALRDCLDRRHLSGHVEQIRPGRYHIRHTSNSAKVGVVIPTRDRVDLLRPCLDSVDRHPDAMQIRRVIVDNGSVEDSTAQYLADVARRADTRVIRDDGPFNWSRLNNVGAAAIDCDLLLFLNNDVEALHDGWLQEMVGLACRPGVGVVGAKLVFPDGRIQHGGVVLGGGGAASHAFYGTPDGSLTYFDYAAVVRNVSAVTGACLLTPQALFQALDGFDERLPVAYNDTDYCLRVRAHGRRVVWTPHAVLLHRESASRGHHQPESDVQTFREAWWQIIADGDPFSNPNLDLDSRTYAIRTAPRARRRSLPRV